MFQKLRNILSELIGRVSVFDLNIARSKGVLTTRDLTKPDYSFWDRFRRGKVKGYFLSSLFAKRIEKIFSSWVFGSGFEILTVSKDVYTNKLLADFGKTLLSGGSDDRHDSLLQQLFETSLGLGDEYVVMNHDGSITVPSPDTVTVLFDEFDYRIVRSVIVFYKTLTHSITETFTETTRTLLIKKGIEVILNETYDNLFGYVPVTHITNGRGVNEGFGHPIHEPLLPLYDLFDDTQFKQVNGARLLGNPILALVGLKNIKKVKEANTPSAAQTYTDSNGVEVTRDQFKVDNDSVLLLGEGGDAKFVSPPVGFTRDTRNTLDSLFLLLIYHIGIPAFIWGAEMNAARASSETQMSQWVHDIEGIQNSVGNWLLRMCKMWLKAQSFIDKKIDTETELTIKWKPLVPIDENVVLKRLQLAADRDWIQPSTGLAILQLVDNPEEESAKAQKLAEEKAQKVNDAAVKLKQGDPGVKKPGSSKNTDTVP